MAKRQPVKCSINGFQVDFPCKPYPTQVAMMDKILKAIDREENALLESPTGSGKSLALLCSTLSWQRKARETVAQRVMEARQEMEQAGDCYCTCHRTGVPVQPPTRTSLPPTPSLALGPGGHDAALLPTPSLAPSLGGHDAALLPTPTVVPGATPQSGLGAPIGPLPVGSSAIDLTGASSRAGPVQTFGHPTPAAVSTAMAARSGGGFAAGSTPIVLGGLPCMSVPVPTSSGSGDSTGNGKRACAGVDSDDSDPDFKPVNKKLRGSINTYPRPRQHRGIKYEDDDPTGDSSSSHVDGSTMSIGGSGNTPSWSCQLKSGVATPVTSMPGVAGGDVTASYAPSTPEQVPSSASSSGAAQVCFACKCTVHDYTTRKALEKQVRERVPTIFYGTRTHKQVAQIIGELRKTVFNNVRMTILASREHYCVHPVVSKSANKSELCREHVKRTKKKKEYFSGDSSDDSLGELEPSSGFGRKRPRRLFRTKHKKSKRLDTGEGRSKSVGNEQENTSEPQKDGDCRFYRNIHKINSFENIALLGLDHAWDIEELVTLAKQKKTRACPYFGARELAKGAQIIFCPYNYLIDPLIRKQMDIELRGNVVVLDEAHNIEDSARDAASADVKFDDIELALINLRKLLEKSILARHHRPLESMLSSLAGWIKSMEGNLISNEFEKYSRTWTGIDMVRELDRKCAINSQTLSLYRTHYAEAQKHLAEQRNMATQGDPRDANDLDDEMMLGPTAALFDTLFMVLSFLLDNNARHAIDYRINIEKVRGRPKPVVNRGFIRRPREDDAEFWSLTLHFWCLNPAVCFKEIDNAARTIVLTSGTLAPIDSFSSELGVMFKIAMEGNHVVPKDQVWVQTLGAGPNHVKLNAAYKFVETLEFQDELGMVIMQICQTVPFGVLCFLPSYSMMDKLMRRWSMTGLVDHIRRTKHVLLEPRHGRDEFDAMLQEFYDSVNAAVARGLHHGGLQTGALLFAVCRGKVSEGLDFSDNNARAVITIGIPFPNFKDKLVELKRAYNNEQVNRGLLNGSEWYEIQAFRALNQALGRCIRHKGDWGALFLIDERFRMRQGRYVNGLSKWVRGSVHHAESCQSAIGSLKDFVQHRLQCAAVEAAETAAAEKSEGLFAVTPATPMASDTGASFASTLTPGAATAAETSAATLKHVSAFAHSTPRGPMAAFNPPASVSVKKECDAVQAPQGPMAAFNPPASVSVKTEPGAVPTPSTMLTPYCFVRDANIRLKQAYASEPAPCKPVQPLDPAKCTPLLADHAYFSTLPQVVDTHSRPGAAQSTSTGPTVFGGMLTSNAGNEMDCAPAVANEADSTLMDDDTLTPDYVPSPCRSPVNHQHTTAPVADADSTVSAIPSHSSSDAPATATGVAEASGSPDAPRQSPVKRRLGTGTRAVKLAAHFQSPVKSPLRAEAASAQSPRRTEPSAVQSIYPVLTGQDHQQQQQAGRTTATPSYAAASVSGGMCGHASTVAQQAVAETSSTTTSASSIYPSLASLHSAAVLATSSCSPPASRGAATCSSNTHTVHAGLFQAQSTPGANRLGSRNVLPAPARTDEIEISDSDSDSDIIESSQKAQLSPGTAVIPESPPLLGNNSDSDSDLPPESGVLAPGSRQRTMSEQERLQQEEDDLLVQLTQEAEASLSMSDSSAILSLPPSPKPTAIAGGSVYGGLCTKRRNTRICPSKGVATTTQGLAASSAASLPPTAALTAASAGISTRGTATEIGSCVTATSSRHEAMMDVPSAMVPVLCRRCSTHIALTWRQDEEQMHKENLKQIPPVFNDWLQSKSPASRSPSATKPGGTRTRGSKAGGGKCGSASDAIRARPLSTAAAGGGVNGALRPWTHADQSSDCILAKDMQVTLQPLMCSACAAAQSTASSSLRTRRAAAAAKSSAGTQQAPLAVGFRCLPLQGSSSTGGSSKALSTQELWLLSSCCTS
ncbi:uncharacterized protein LOC135823764 isoform X2 [Sycon ciliatum]|uniref:uncharacterized protein LOC135823764 isoform X2 n=1 Tax=Sycon ciliatum TaxID=27933 RepID=UPI0031F64947